MGGPIFDINFMIYTVQGQELIIELCKDMKEQSFIVPGSVNCWLDPFKKFVEEKGETIPLKANRF